MLNGNTVESLFFGSMFQPGEDTSKAVKVPGIRVNVGFHPDRLEANREAVEALIEELPDEFRTSGGGGWSFLNLCTTKTGELWTGQQNIAEQLYLLAAGLGKARFLLPREIWPAMPGGVPYMAFD